MALIVYPIKNAPNGNNNAPITSASPDIIPAYFGPNHIPASAIGTKLKPIDKIAVFIDRNLASTIVNASNSADKIIFFVFDIKKPPNKFIQKEKLPFVNIEFPKREHIL